MPKKDAVCALAAINKLYLYVKTATYIKSPAPEHCESKQTEEENSTTKASSMLGEKHQLLSFSPAHQPSSNGVAERMVGTLKSTVLECYSKLI